MFTRAAETPNVSSPHGWKEQSSDSSPGLLSLCVLINLEVCLFLSELSGLGRALKLGKEAQDGLRS